MSEKSQEDAKTAWEDEGGTPAAGETQKTPKGHEIPVPKRKHLTDAFHKIVQPVKKS